jgi:tetratricopeptide (TPR) repeat protein
MLGTTPLRGIAEGYVQRTKAVAERTDDPFIRAWALQFAAAFYGTQGKWECVRDDAGAAASIHADLGDQRYYNQGLLILAMGELQLGNLEQALELMSRIEPQAERHQDVQMLLWILLTKMEVYSHTDEANMLALLDKLHSLLPLNLAVGDQIWGNGALARTYLHIGTFDLAEKHAEKALDLMGQTRPVAWHVFWGYSDTVVAYLGLWETTPSPDMEKSARKAIKSLYQFARIFPFAMVRARLYQSRYQWLRGKTGKARQNALKALKVAQNLRMRYDEGVAHDTLARYFSAHEPEYRNHLEQALDIFTALGMMQDVERAQQALGQHEEVTN